MESQPQNPEFRNNPENFHPCIDCLCIRIEHYMKGTRDKYLGTKTQIEFSVVQTDMFHFSSVK